MQSSQDCSKSNGDQVQHVLLAAIWRLQHPHCLSPGQGEAWKGINPAGSPAEANPPPASGKWKGGGGEGGCRGRGKEEWRQPCRSSPVIGAHCCETICCILMLKIYCAMRILSIWLAFIDLPSFAVALDALVAFRIFIIILYLRAEVSETGKMD